MTPSTSPCVAWLLRKRCLQLRIDNHITLQIITSLDADSCSEQCVKKVLSVRHTLLIFPVTFID